MSDRLTPKQAMFVQEYLTDLNATQAAIRSGYSAQTAGVIGHENLKKPNICDAIKEAQDAIAARTTITPDRVVSELGKLGFSNMLDYVEIGDDGQATIDLSTMSRDQAAALTELTVEEITTGTRDNQITTKRTKIKLADKRASLVDLGRYLNMFKERVEVSGPDGGPIQLEAARTRIQDRLRLLRERSIEGGEGA